jgi:hypothetical protein
VCGLQLRPYPSAVWPLQMCSARNSEPAPGSDGCLLMWNTYTSVEGDLVATAKGF